ncbi:MAG: hypothetical protein KI790_00500 [Cyclobacteriaceae bacterium]|nr:hypothetical protein [Cyclobacteriaceae bacterium HetDA_MAG_MS6]
MRKFLLFSALVCITFALKAQEGEFTDPRDGTVYKILTFEIPLPGGVSVKRTWMAENLRYDVQGSYCYLDEPAYCEAFGKLYTYESAKSSCPEGWKMPSIKDWTLLFSKYGGIREAGTFLIKGGDSGMNLQLGGFGDPGSVFKNVGISGNYWDSELKSEETAGLITVQEGSPEIFHGVIGNWHRNSCRCIKEY